MPLYTVCLGGKTRGRTATKRVQKKTRKFKKGAKRLLFSYVTQLRTDPEYPLDQE